MFEAGQWSLYATQSGRWDGVWTTYDQFGTQHSEIEGVWQVELLPDNNAKHTLSVNGNEIPVGTYSAGNLGKQVCAGAGMVAGPSVLKRSGLVSTEISLRYGISRLRCTVQHAPAYAEAEEPGLLLYRVILCRERGDGGGPPTRAKEEARNNDFGVDEARFWRGIPPYRWNEAWRGTSTTASQQVLAQFEVDSVPEEDEWHLSRSGEASYTLQLPGGIRIQAPTLIRPGIPAPIRLAWLPCDMPILLRAQAFAVALEPDDDNSAGGASSGQQTFKPPSLLSFRVDELEATSPPSQNEKKNGDDDDLGFLRGL